MRTIFSLLLLLVSGVALAQEGGTKEKFGFVRLVNAVAPGEGKLELFIEGSSIYPDGYKLGDVTGGIGVALGRCKVVIKRNGVREGTTSVEIAEGETTTIIPFAERVPASDDEPAYWQVKILRLKQGLREEGRSATFVSVALEAEVPVELRDPEGNWEKVFVKRFGTARAPIKYPKGYVPVRIKTGPLPSIPVMDEGNYVVVLDDDPEGNLSALSFRDFRFLTAD